MTDGGSYRVRVDGIGFAAGHFATMGRSAERLHGHNYQVSAEVEGELTDDSWVVDFIALKSLLRELADELDHRFLLQRDSRVLEIEATDGAWKVKTPEGVDYVLPRQDVVALPIDNSTAERLSQWFCRRAWAELRRRGAANLASVTIEVHEGPDQRASHRLTAGD